MLLNVKKFKLTRDSSLFLFLLFFALGKTLFFSNFGLKMLNDDLQNFTGAARILSGEVIYRDYQAFFPPLADYLLAFLLKVDEGSIVVSRYFYALLSAFVFPILFLITRKIANKAAAFLVAFVLIFADTRVDLLFFYTFLLASFLFAVKHVESKDYKWAFLSGIGLALGSFFRIDFALNFSLGILVLFLTTYLPGRDFRGLFRAILSFAVFPVVFNLLILGWLLNSGLMTPMLAHLKAGIGAKGEYFINYFSPSYLFPKELSKGVAYNAFTGWLYILWILTFASFFSKIREKKLELLKVGVIFGMLATFGASFVYLRSQFDIPHLIKGAMLVFPVLGFIASFSKSLASRLALFSLFAFGVVQISLSLWFLSFNDSEALFTRGGSVYLNGKYIKGTTLPSTGMVTEAVEFLKQAEKDEPVFAAPYLSMLYFLSERKNPTIYDNLLKGYLVEPFDEDYVIGRLEQKGVRYVVYDRGVGPRREGGSRLQDHYPKIDEYLMGNFVVEKQLEGWLLMRKND